MRALAPAALFPSQFGCGQRSAAELRQAIPKLSLMLRLARFQTFQILFSREIW